MSEDQGRGPEPTFEAHLEALRYEGRRYRPGRLYVRPHPGEGFAAVPVPAAPPARAPGQRAYRDRARRFLAWREAHGGSR